LSQNDRAPPEKVDPTTVTTFVDHEVITPPHRLRKAVSPFPAAPGDDPLQRAEQALSQLANEFDDWMQTECERLDTARGRVRTGGLTEEHYAELFHAAHDIKGEAATLGFPLVTAVADSLCRLIEHTPEVAQIPFPLIDQHVDAVRAIVREYSRPDVESVATSLSRCLREVTDQFLTEANKDRPDYLADIVAPPIAAQSKNG
jgi:HPt (histidine-containing phosphotransfer) domain-containing protein